MSGSSEYNNNDNNNNNNNNNIYFASSNTNLKIQKEQIKGRLHTLSKQCWPTF